MILLHAVRDLDDLQDFFTELVKVCLDVDSPGARLDFLACPLTQSNDASEIVQILEDLTHVGFAVSSKCYSRFIVILLFRRFCCNLFK